ncbi:hypothetical protein GCM10010317_002370 [Streptomyces mirabilis]|nr:hypothetical protein GCM10010317_002370 [Streptomyces mirabilis]
MGGGTVSSFSLKPEEFGSFRSFGEFEEFQEFGKVVEAMTRTLGRLH